MNPPWKHLPPPGLAATLGIGAALVAIIIIAAFMPKDGVEAGEFEFGTDPVELLAQHALPEHAHYDHAVWAEGEFLVPHDAWITTFSAELLGAPPDKMHNFFVYRKSANDAWCPENPEMIWAGGTVSSRNPMEFPPPYGVHVRKGETVVVRAMLTNLADEQHTGYENVSLRVRAGYTDDTARRRNVMLYMIGPEVCESGYPIFPLPPHSKDAVYGTEEKPFVLPLDGEIVRARGHYHGSYERDIVNTLRLYIDGRMVEEVSSSDIGNDAERNPLLLGDELPLAVSAGDSVWMEAVFSNPSDETVPEGMAIIGLFFSPF